MLKSQFFHANALDRITKVQEQLNVFLGRLGDDAVISVNTTEVGPAGNHDFYSYTVLVIYRES